MNKDFKCSGAEWIGDIPEDWETTTVGAVYKERREKVSDTDFAPLSVTMSGIVPQLGYVVKTEDNDNRKLILKGDFVINSRSDRRGALGVSDYDGSCSVINTVLTTKNGENVDFYNYAFQTPLFPSEYYRYGHGIVGDLWTTHWSEMKNITLPSPDSETRKKISAYLDVVTSMIDFTITQLKESIEEYKSLKNSVITDAIIHGIEGASEKKSEICWMGTAPTHWNTLMVRQMCFPVKQQNKGLIEKNLLSLSYGHIVRKNIDSTEGLIPESYDGYNIIEANDIVLRLTDLQNDHRSLRCGYAEEKGIITSAYLTVRTRNNINSKYLYYCFHAFDISKGFYSMGGGIRQSLAWDELKTLKFAVPSPEEQNRIVRYLDFKCLRYDCLISQEENLISELLKYKKTIIYEYVTGKKEVPA